MLRRQENLLGRQARRMGSGAVQRECRLQLKKKLWLSFEPAPAVGVSAISMSDSQGIPEVLCKLHSYTKIYTRIASPIAKMHPQLA